MNLFLLGEHCILSNGVEFRFAIVDRDIYYIGANIKEVFKNREFKIIGTTHFFESLMEDDFNLNILSPLMSLCKKDMNTLKGKKEIELSTRCSTIVFKISENERPVLITGWNKNRN